MFPGCVDDFVERYADSRVKEFYLGTSVWKPLGIIVIYILFTQWLGPWFMKDRKPINVRKYVMIYDIVQIVTNFLMTIAILMNFSQNNSLICMEVDYSDSTFGRRQLLLTYFYFLLKLLDVVDTVFFIFKKSYRQVNFLHIYHHASMIFFTWLTWKYVSGGLTVWIGVTNTIVHTIMYSYYLLTAFDDSYKNVPGFKKFVTQCQLAQFCLVAIVGILSFTQPCKFSNGFRILFIVQDLYFAYLFAKFYYYEYLCDSKPKKAKKTM